MSNSSAYSQTSKPQILGGFLKCLWYFYKEYIGNSVGPANMLRGFPSARDFEVLLLYLKAVRHSTVKKLVYMYLLLGNQYSAVVCGFFRCLNIY